jgi:hypothetical protein
VAAQAHWMSRFSRLLATFDPQRPGARRLAISIFAAILTASLLLRALFALALWFAGAPTPEIDARITLYPALFILAFIIAARGKDMRALALLGAALLPVVLTLDPLLQLVRLLLSQW